MAAVFTDARGRPDSGREGVSMQISERPVGDVIIVDVSGKITLGEGGNVLKDKMRSLVQQGHKKVLLNLGDVSYIDSAGLGEIVQSYATLTKNGGSLKLLNVTKRIQDLLSITRLLTVFECHDSEATAVSSFAAPA
jgi:anti-sigma B factor antagonist